MAPAISNHNRNYENQEIIAMPGAAGVVLAEVLSKVMANPIPNLISDLSEYIELILL